MTKVEVEKIVEGCETAVAFLAREDPGPHSDQCLFDCLCVVSYFRFVYVIG